MRIQVLVYAPALPPLQRLRSPEDCWCSAIIALFHTPRGTLVTKRKESRRGSLRVSVAIVQSEVNAVSLPTPHRSGGVPHARRACRSNRSEPSSLIRARKASSTFYVF
jgi:hypothetical protein